MRGFALVATLVLMVLLALLSLGMLSLSAISLRSASRGSEQAQARANARLALMLAIGSLQKNAGSDTRVTAPADILSSANPPLTGVWRSWEGTDNETSGQFAGRPLSPAYDDKKRSAADGGRFLTWLVSGAEGAAPDDAAKLVLTSPSATSVPIISSRALAPDDGRQVHLNPVAVGDDGAMAWWVSGENQKALIPKPSEPKDNTPAGWALSTKSHSTADPLPFGLESLLADASAAPKLVSRRTVDLIVANGTGKLPHQFFHDLSVSSVGLLTNTATGGWRKDLSLLTEDWGNQALSNQPFFRITPSEDSSAAIPTPGDPTPEGGVIYPWSEPINRDVDSAYAKASACSSWGNLQDYATFYKKVSVSPDGYATAALQSENIEGSGLAVAYGFVNRIRVRPLIARIHWVFSHASAELPAADGEDPLYEPRLHLTPVVTVWNPYNVQITSPTKLEFKLLKALPTALKYHIGDEENPSYNSLTTALSNQPPLSVTGSGRGDLDFRIAINSAFTLIPGETKVFSPAADTAVKHSNSTLVLAPGYRSGGGYYFQVRGSDGNAPLKLPGSTRIKADAKFDTDDDYPGAPGVSKGVGVYFDVRQDKKTVLAYRMAVSPETANAFYPEISDMAEVSLDECEENPLPFMSSVFGTRTASSINLATKGFVQSSPLVDHGNLAGNGYLGAQHPVNSTFDYRNVKHPPGGDNKLPNAGNTNNRGFIITGFTSADGLSRCVIADLPLQPLASLCELTHWDARHANTVPPFSMNQIGNSDATPLIPADAVYNSRNASDPTNRQHDDSYCLNHLLFDDWFFSSIAPESKLAGSSPRNQQQVYEDFLRGDVSLANSAYRPIAEDASAATTGAAYDANVKPSESWKSIASRLEVEGMFNVNSTSETAWRALLGHARNRRVPYIRESDGGWDVGLSGKSDHVLSRFGIAGDTEAGTPGLSGSFPEATQFSGYRTVGGPFLDKLSSEVVKQIRARGPFLSLSEFVNRQLSSGDPALAGTIQAALDELSKNPATDPFKDLKALSTVTDPNPPNAPSPEPDEEYQFRKAAEGYSAYGLPGWTRQADILRPLAPILSARDDTFTIRAYGDARDKAGNVTARATCQAVVRRTRKFVDPGDAPDLFSAPTLGANQTLGRRFELVSFRWLNENEI